MLTRDHESVHLRCMKTIITFTFGLLLAVSTITTVSAQVYSNSYGRGHHDNNYANCGGNVSLYPYLGVSIGCSGNYNNNYNNYYNQQAQTVYSYYYTSGCYTYYYNGVTRTSSVSSYNCQTQPTYTYTQPTQQTYTYYTQPTTYTYYTQPTYTYTTYPSYYTNTGYNNYYNSGVVYTPTTNCYYSTYGVYTCY